MMGLGARGVTVARPPASCALAAATDDLPPCWVLFGGAGVSWVLGAVDLPRAGAAGLFPGVLPRGALGTPLLSCMPGASREGVGARHVAPWPGELGRAGDLDGGGCLPEGAAGGSRILPEGTLRGCTGSR